MNNYEQKYKEALERAKAMIKVASNQNEAIGFANTIFPELAESEDERIRNGLVRLLKELLELGGVAEDEWDRNECEKYIAWVEKQGEKKSTEWSEEDEHRIKDTVYFLETAKEHYASTEELDACIDWLKSLKDHVQPRQEWSEEDEMERKRVVGLLEGWLSTFKETCYANDCKSGINWLKSLKERVQSQPKQEWSEEEEAKLKIACALIRNTNLIGNEDVVNSTINWLKSLKDRVQPQSQWKPSEEQMKALDAVRHNNSYNVRMLDILFHDLKKLTE